MKNRLLNRLYGIIAISCFVHCHSFAMIPQHASTDGVSVVANEVEAMWGVSFSKKHTNNDQDESNSHIYNSRLRGPPTDAIYELEAKIPVIGVQLFKMRIINDGMAELVINGLLEVKELISYTIDHNGEFVFELSAATQGVLRKFRTTLVKVKYCRETDAPTVVVRPPLPMNIQLKLERKKKQAILPFA